MCSTVAGTVGLLRDGGWKFGCRLLCTLWQLAGVGCCCCNPGRPPPPLPAPGGVFSLARRLTPSPAPNLATGAAKHDGFRGGGHSTVPLFTVRGARQDCHRGSGRRLTCSLARNSRGMAMGARRAQPHPGSALCFSGARAGAGSSSSRHRRYGWRGERERERGGGSLAPSLVSR